MYITKRYLVLKRPAVLCAAAFALGIVLEEQGKIMLLAVTLLLAAGISGFLGELLFRRQRLSISDKLLFLAPFFCVLGFGRMELVRTAYEENQSRYKQCLSEGSELLLTGRATKLSFTRDGFSFELKQAKAASFAAEGTVYQKVGTLVVYCPIPSDGTEPVKDGQSVFLFGKGSEFLPAENPGQFDAKQFYFSKNITGAFTASKIEITDFSYHRLNQALFQIKKRILQSFSEYLGTGAGVISSMLLGERALLPEETNDLYRRGGISHILAISGLHVSMFGAAVYTALRRTFFGRNGAIPIAGGCVLLYGELVNAGVSTKRAMIMFLLLLLATVLGRTYDTLSAMSVSLLVLLFQSPGALFTASFQLSFAAAYAASVFAGVLGDEKDRDEKERKEGKSTWKRWLEKGKETAQFGLAITLITFPVTAVHFFEFPLYGCLINPIVVPLMNVLLSCAILSGGLGMVFPVAGVFFAGTVRAILWLYELLCRIISIFPFSVLLIGKPKRWQVGLYYLLLFAGIVLWKQNRRKLRLRNKRTGERVPPQIRLYHAAFAVLPFCLLPYSANPFEVTFLSVGQGEAIVIEEGNGVHFGKNVYLVDGGSSSISGVGAKRLIPFLKSKGIGRIAGAFVSHIDEDHINGLSELLTLMPDCGTSGRKSPVYAGTILVERLILPALLEKEEGYLRLVSLAEQKGVELVYVSAGDRISTGDGTGFLCMSPDNGKRYEDRNSASMVLGVEFGVLRLLLTGDATKEVEAQIIRYLEKSEWSEQRKVTVLKAGHHGSDTSTSEELLWALKPEITVISCGRNNRYGHPHEETIRRLEAIGCKILRTDELGAIVFTISSRGEVKQERY